MSATNVIVGVCLFAVCGACSVQLRIVRFKVPLQLVAHAQLFRLRLVLVETYKLYKLSFVESPHMAPLLHATLHSCILQHPAPLCVALHVALASKASMEEMKRGHKTTTQLTHSTTSNASTTSKQQ